MTPRRMLQWTTLVTAVACSLWFYPATLDPFNITKLAVLLVGAAALIGLLGGTYKSWWSKSESWLLGVVGLFVVGLTAAGLASDRVLFRTLWGAWARNDGWFAYASLAVVLLATALAFRGSQVEFGMYALIGVGVCEVGYGLLQTTGNDPVAWNSGYNPIIGTVGNPNFASALLGIAAVAMAWLALDATKHIALRAGSAFIGLVAVFLTVRSDSIQGTLAFGAGFAMLLAGWLSAPEQRESLRKLTWPYVGVVGFSGALGAIGLAGMGPLSFLDSQNLQNRKYYWKTAWHMFESNPLFGVGLDSLGDFYRSFRALHPEGAPGFDVSTNAAHSIVFQLLATGGLALGGTYLLLQAFVVWRAVVALRSGQNRLLASGVFGAWLAFLLQSLFSIDQLGLTVWGWVLGGLVVGVSYAEPARTAPSKRGARRAVQQQAQAGLALGAVLAVLLGLGGAMLAAVPLSKDSAIRDAVGYQIDVKQSAQVAAVQAAVLAAADGADDPYWRMQLIGKLYQIGAVDAGISLAQKSVEMFPDDSQIWNLIAIAYEQTGRAKLAIPAREKSIEFDPLNETYKTLLAQDQAAK